MNILSIIRKTILLCESDEDHQKALEDTGFWGKQGAGAIILSNKTKRILLPFRSDHVQEPNTWGVWGGAIDDNESPKLSAEREIREEVGYDGRINQMIPLYVFKDRNSGFRYYNFLAIVDDEFKPNLNWETETYGWFDFNQIPKNRLHFGLENLLNDGKSLETIKSYIKKG
jgi:8-oxo-dGTP pyrophosphatase MutT (NUDIX family)